MSRVSMGLPRSTEMDQRTREEVSLYSRDTQIINRTMIVSVNDHHDLVMILDALSCSGLLPNIRWINYSTTD